MRITYYYFLINLYYLKVPVFLRSHCSHYILTELVVTLWYYLPQCRGGAGAVEGADVEMISWVRENQPDLRMTGVHALTWGLPRCFPNGHIEAFMQLFSRKLTNSNINYSCTEDTFTFRILFKKCIYLPGYRKQPGAFSLCNVGIFKADNDGLRS